MNKVRIFSIVLCFCLVVGLITYTSCGGGDDEQQPDVFTRFDCPAVWAIAIDSLGAKWFGTYNDGVRYLDDNGTPTNTTDDTWVEFTFADGLADDFTHSIAIDASGVKWFGTTSGINYFDDAGTPTNTTDDTWVTYNTTDGLAGDYTTAVVIDVSGAKWIGCLGVSYFDDAGTPTIRGDDTWVTFTTADGLTNNGVETIAIDASGAKWIGSWGGNGVSYFDDMGTPTNKADDTWTIYEHYFTMAIVIDASGGKWFGTSVGASYLP